MFFFNGLRRSARPMRTYQPCIGVLEDRIVPAPLRLFGPAPISVAVGTATHLEVIVPQDVTVDTSVVTPTPVTAVALNASNQVVPGYAGTVTLTSTDSGANTPLTYTFSAKDLGKHTFDVDFKTAGTQTVTAANGSVKGSASLKVETVGPVTHFGVVEFPSAVAGYPAYVDVVALDANGNAVPGYTGTVHFTSTDPWAALPDDYTFSAADNGSHLFAVAFASVGKQTLTVTDTGSSTIAGSVSFHVQTPWYFGGFGFFL